MPTLGTGHRSWWLCPNPGLLPSIVRLFWLPGFRGAWAGMLRLSGRKPGPFPGEPPPQGGRQVIRSLPLNRSVVNLVNSRHAEAPRKAPGEAQSQHLARAQCFEAREGWRSVVKSTAARSGRHYTEPTASPARAACGHHGRRDRAVELWGAFRGEQWRHGNGNQRPGLTWPDEPGLWFSSAGRLLDEGHDARVVAQ
jgi:hypothetical protein